MVPWFLLQNTFLVLLTKEYNNIPQIIEYLDELRRNSETDSEIPDDLTANRPEESVFQTGGDSVSDQYPLTEVLESLLNGRPLPYLESVSSSGHTYVLYYTGRELSRNLIQDFNNIAAQSPEKQFWLAYNDFNNSNYLQYLGKLSPECYFLPLKPDPAKNKQWLFADTFTEKRIFSQSLPSFPCAETWKGRISEMPEYSSV